MIALLLIAAMLAAVSIWWISRPLRLRMTVPAGSERAELAIVRDRLLAQLRELEAERADHGIEVAVAETEELRLSAELADVLKRLEALPATAPPVEETATPVRAWGFGMTAGLAAFLLLIGGGLYAWQNAANLKGFALAARGGVPGGNVPPMVFEMVAKLEERLAANPDDAGGWARLGRSYVVLKQMDKARDAYARAHQLAPDNIEFLSDYAWLVFTASPGTTSGLVYELYSKLARLEPNHVDALWFLGIAAYQKGDSRGALRFWERLATQLKPGSPEMTELGKMMQAARNQVANPGRR